jgi:tRNA-modifying protein YgfZ
MTVFFSDRSDRVKLRFTGPQRAWFLHQILTQDFENIGPGESREAALLTAHGRMVGYLEIVATEDALLAHMEPELGTTLPEDIRRYVFATQVEIEDVTEEMALILVAGDSYEELVGPLAATATQATHALGVPAAYVWLSAEEKSDAMAALDEGARQVGEAELEAVRIAHGVARWGKDMDQKTFPQEAGIDGYAVHFEKGCYVGQEAMAKIHFRGKVNRRLALLEGQKLDEGAEVTAEDQKVGVVTSSVPDHALAMVKYTVEPGTVVTVDGKEAKVVA